MAGINIEQWEELARVAWQTRDFAYIIGDTKVGSALLTIEGKLFSGCNVEHRFRINDSHAEVNAITTMVASGYRSLKAIIVVSERKKFTPCGSCMDWIFQFGGPDCEVAYQSGINGEIFTFTAKELMPHYPVS
jgi:cytidine deaminase